MTIAMDRATKQSACSAPSAGPSWRIGIVTDTDGHVHLGAVIDDAAAGPRRFVDLLAPAGAAGLAPRDLEHLVVLVNGSQLAELRRLAERCVDETRLRHQLMHLADLAAR